MNSTTFWGDERGVPPVIATVLVVAIAVILSAVVGSFAFDLWNSTGDVPRADFSFEWDDAGADDELTITHETGQHVDADDVVVVSNGVDIEDEDGNPAQASSHTWSDLHDGGIDRVGIGDAVTVRADGEFDGQTVLVVWRDDGRTHELASWEESA